MTPTVSLLQHILARVDLWLARAMRRVELLQNEETHHGGLYVTHSQAIAQLYQAGLNLNLDEEEEQSLLDSITEAKTRTEIAEEELHRRGNLHTISTLATLFELSDLEQDAFIIALAPAIEPRYTTLYSYLQDDVTAKQPRVAFILELLCGTSLDRLGFLNRFNEEGNLRRYGLLEMVGQSNESYRGSSPLYEALQVDPALVQWLLGIPYLHRAIAPHTVLHTRHAVAVFAKNLADETIGTTISTAIEHKAILSLYGSDEQRQQSAAAKVAQTVSKGLLEIELAAAIQGGTDGDMVVRLALRDALLHDAIPCFKGWEDDRVSNSMAQMVYDFPQPLILCGHGRWHGTNIQRTRPILSYACSHPGYNQRLTLWQESIIGSDVVDIELVAGQFMLTSHQIHHAATTARDYALQRGDTVTTADLINAARFHSTPRLGTLAYQIKPRFEWDDIVLPTEQKIILREIVNMVRGRGIVLEEWGLGAKLVSSSGVSALFAGPPGTGKTMAAEVIAGELGLDLYKIDLSSVVNKYIGETEKSLGKLFDEASASNAILFFDEADALFGKRSEVKDSHDRYANIEVSYLLQRMEQYDGITILATNLRSSMDEAFTRRLQFAIDFPFPEEPDRLRLWQTLLPPQVPRDESVNLSLLARRFKLAGGNIRNVIVSAAHIAAANGRVVTQSHLMHGIRRELQKMGRLIDEREMRVD
jgi:ATP-dependent 26S proteasome regulatory subunit